MQKKKMIWVILSAILFFIIFGLIFGMSPNKIELQETNLQDTISETDRTGIKKDAENGIEMKAEKTFTDKIKEIHSEIIPYSESKSSYNELPQQKISETPPILYNISLIGLADQIIQTEEKISLFLPVPNGYEGKNIQVFAITKENTFEEREINVKDNQIIMENINLTPFVVICNESEEDKAPFFIDTVSVKYQEGLTVCVKSSLFTNHNEEVQLLVYNKEKEAFYENNADSKPTSENGLFHIKNISFQNINKPIYMRLYVKEGETEYYGDLIRFDILDYFINQYKNTDNGNVKNVIVGTVVYGDILNPESNIFEKFQKETGYEKTAEETIHGVKPDAVNLHSVEGENVFYGRTVSINNGICYTIYLKQEYKEQASSIQASFTIQNKETKINFEPDEAYNTYKATFTGIQPYDVNTPLFIKIIDKNGKQIGGTLTDSIGTFLSEGMEKYTEKEDRDALLTAAYLTKNCEKWFKTQQVQ